MQNEIELKIMLLPKNIPLIENWIAQQHIIDQGKLTLGNTYYDSEDRYFSRHKMGLRVRTQNNQHEITLKTKGEIVGGLHIRPEYNLALPNNYPDLKGVVEHYNLQFIESTILNKTLLPLFNTDFERHYWLIEFQNAQIEIALDQGIIKNAFGAEPICEIEFELKQGNINALFNLLEAMPKADGMWLSGLSKAQRGYLIGNSEEIAKMCEKLTPCYFPNVDTLHGEQFMQKLADFIRLTNNEELMKGYHLLDREFSQIRELTQVPYLIKTLKTLRQLCA